MRRHRVVNLNVSAPIRVIRWWRAIGEAGRRLAQTGRRATWSLNRQRPAGNRAVSRCAAASRRRARDTARRRHPAPGDSTTRTAGSKQVVRRCLEHVRRVAPGDERFVRGCRIGSERILVENEP
jgi:hypothetical protein